MSLFKNIDNLARMGQVSEETAVALAKIFAGLDAGLDDVLKSGNIEDIKQLQKDAVEAAKESGDVDAIQYLDNNRFLKHLGIASQQVRAFDEVVDAIKNGADIDFGAYAGKYPDTDISVNIKYFNDANEFISKEALAFVDEMGGSIEDALKISRNNTIRRIEHFRQTEEADAAVKLDATSKVDEGTVEYPKDADGNPKVTDTDGFGQKLPNAPKGFVAKLKDYFKPMSSEKWYEKIEGIRERNLVKLFGEKSPLVDGIDNTPRAIEELAIKLRNGELSVNDVKEKLRTIREGHLGRHSKLSYGMKQMKDELEETSNLLDIEKPIKNIFLRTPYYSKITSAWGTKGTFLLPFNALNPGFYLKYIVPDPSQKFQLNAIRKMNDDSIERLSNIQTRNEEANQVFMDLLIDNDTNIDDIVDKLDNSVNNLREINNDVKASGQGFLRDVQEPNGFPNRKNHREDVLARERGILQGLYHKEERVLAYPNTWGTPNNNPEAQAMQLEAFWGTIKKGSGKNTDVTNPQRIAGFLFNLYKSGDGHAGIKAYRRMIRSGGRDRGIKKYGLGQGDIAPDKVLQEIQSLYVAQAKKEGLESAGNITIDKHFQEYSTALDDMLDLETKRQSPEYFGERHGLEFRMKLSQAYEDAFEFTQGSKISPAFVEPHITTPLTNRFLGLRKNKDGNFRPTWRTPFNLVTAGGFTAGTIGTIGGGVIMASATTAEWAGLDDTLGLDTDAWGFNDGFRPQVFASDIIINKAPGLVTGLFGLNNGEGYGIPIYDMLYGGSTKKITPLPLSHTKNDNKTLEQMKDESKDAIDALDDRRDDIDDKFALLRERVNKLAEYGNNEINGYLSIGSEDSDKYNEIHKQLNASIKSLNNEINKDEHKANILIISVLKQAKKTDEDIQDNSGAGAVGELRQQQIDLIKTLNIIEEINIDREKEIADTRGKYMVAIDGAKPFSTPILAVDIAHEKETARLQKLADEQTEVTRLQKLADEQVETARLQKLADEETSNQTQTAGGAEEVTAGESTTPAIALKTWEIELNKHKTDAAKTLLAINSNAKASAGSLGLAQDYLKKMTEHSQNIELVRKGVLANNGTNKNTSIQALNDLLVTVNANRQTANDKIAELQTVKTKADEIATMATTIYEGMANANQEDDISTLASKLTTLQAQKRFSTAASDEADKIAKEIHQIGYNNQELMLLNTDYKKTHANDAQSLINKGALYFGKNSLVYQLIGESDNGADSALDAGFNLVSGYKKKAGNWWDKIERNSKSKEETNWILGLKAGGLFFGGMMALNALNSLPGVNIGKGLKLTILGGFMLFLLKKTGDWGDKIEGIREGRTPFAQGNRPITARGASLEPNSKRQIPTSAFSTDPKKAGDNKAGDNKETNVVPIRSSNPNAKPVDHIMIDLKNGTFQAHKGGMPSNGKKDIIIPQEVKNKLIAKTQGECKNLVDHNQGASSYVVDNIKNKDGKVLQAGPVTISFKGCDISANDASNLGQASGQ